MNCSKAQNLVQDLTDGRLADGIARELQRHLTDCTDCRVTQQRVARLQQLLSVKRHELPGQDYFDGFLREFHYRLQEAITPQPSWWDRMLNALDIENTWTLRYGYAHSFGVLLAVGMILRGFIAVEGDRAAAPLSLDAHHLQTASALPHSQPRKIAATLPPMPEPAPATSGAMILPFVPRDEPNIPRYVLDRINLSPANYEVASIHF